MALGQTTIDELRVALLGLEEAEACAMALQLAFERGAALSHGIDRINVQALLAEYPESLVWDGTIADQERQIQINFADRRARRIPAWQVLPAVTLACQRGEVSPP